jgi:hypothetical protein
LLLDDEENLELSFENFSFSPSVHQQDKPITSPLSPYTSPSPLHEYALFDDEEDKLEALVRLKSTNVFFSYFII